MNQKLIGQRVVNVHRMSVDNPNRVDYIGTVLDIESGIYGAVIVKFDGLEFVSAMCRQDLALCSDWLNGKRISDYL